MQKKKSFVSEDVSNGNCDTNEDSTILTVDAVAALTGYKKSYIYKLCHQRAIPYYNRYGGRKCFFLLHEINAWCTERRNLSAGEIKSGSPLIKPTIK